MTERTAAEIAAWLREVEAEDKKRNNRPLLAEVDCSA